MTEVYVVGTDMIKFGRFPDRTVPNLGAEAALMALDDAGLTIQDMQALYCGNLGEAGGHGRPAGAARDRPDRHPGGQRRQRLRHRRDRLPRRLDGDQGRPVRRRPGVGVEQMGKGLLGGGGGGVGHPDRGPAGLGHHALGVRPRRHGAHPQVRHHLRAVRQGVGEEPPPLHPEPQGDVPDRNPAPGSDGRGDDLLSEHQADVLGERRRLGRRGARFGERRQAARADGAGGAGARLGDDQRSLHAAQPGHAGLQRGDAPGRQAAYERPASGPRTSTSSSCTTASPPPRSSTTRTSASAPTARRAG